MNREHLKHYYKRCKRLKKKVSAAGARVFAVILALGTAVGLCLPLRPQRSELEKRKLEEFPALTASGLWDGSWFEGVSTWYSDTYPLRESLIGGASRFERLYGVQGEQLLNHSDATGDKVPEIGQETTPAPVITATPEPEAEAGPEQTPEPTQALEDGTIHQEPEMAGDVYLSGDTAFEIYYFNQGGADAYASMLNTVQARLGGSAAVYDLLAPTSFGVCLDESIQEKMGGSLEKNAFAYIYSRLDPAVRRVDVMEELIRHNAEYLYYRTDHHWTALGAYYAYRVFAEQKGIQPHELSEFEKREYPGFLGTFYAYSNQSAALGDHSDTVEAYIPMGTNDAEIQQAEGGTLQWFVVSDVSDYGEGAKYSCFIGGDNPFTRITNPQIQDGSSCVVVKESYGNAFVPWLVDHYQNVYVVDYRYYTGNLTQFIRENSVQDVIFVNNADALSESSSGKMLALFPEG